MKHSIKEILREVFKPLKFNKIEVELFNTYDETSYDYDNNSTNANSYSTPNRIKIRITPVFDLTGSEMLKYGNSLDIDLEQYGIKFYDSDGINNTLILCQEGILSYEYDSDSDCDGSYYSFSGNFTPHNKITDWDKIKNIIKPKLTQADIDKAIRTIGKEKEFCKKSNYTGKLPSYISFLNKLKKENKISYYSCLDSSGNCSGYVILKINNKYGLSTIRNGQIITIIPYVYDNYLVKNDNELKFKKGDFIYIYNRNNSKWKWVMDKKENKLNSLKKLQDVYNNKSDRYKENNDFEDFLYEYDLIKIYEFYK